MIILFHEQTFPHNINLIEVHRETDKQLITEINEFCSRTPIPQNELFIISLSRPITNESETLHNFGTNLEVNLYHYFKVDLLQANHLLFTSTYSGLPGK